MSRRRLFGSLLGLVFLVNMARVAFAPLIEPLMATYGVGAAAAGLVATLAWLGSALVRVPVGYLLTRVSRHRVILGAGSLLTVAAVGAALAPSIALLGVGAFVMGVASGAYFIAANPLVSELYPDRVGRAIGTHYTAAQAAAVAAAPAVGAFLAFGGIRSAFLALAAAAAAVTAVLAVAIRGATLPEAGAGDRDFLRAVRAEWPLVLTGVAVLGVAGFVWNGVFNFYVTYLVEAKGLPQGTARNLLTAVFAAGLPAIWTGGRLADRLPYIPLMLGTLAAFAAVLLGLTAVRGVLPLLAVGLVLGYVIHTLFPVLDTYLLDSLSDDTRASAYAVYSGTVSVIMSGGSSAVGVLTEAGVPFEGLFRAFALAVAATILGLAALHAAGRLPRGDGF